MKYFIGIVSALAILLVFAFCFPISPAHKEENQVEYLRIHIRANSNDIEDQNVKYKVKEEQIVAQNPEVAFPVSEDTPIVLFYQKLQ